MNNVTRLRACVLSCALLTCVACETMPKDAFRLSETAMETRSIQSREFQDVTDIEILSASTAVLQDLGYAIDEVEKELGVLTASKRADAKDPRETIGLIVLDTATCILTLLIGCDNENYLTADSTQDIRLTLVVLPALDDDRAYNVRMTMQRVIWDRENRLKDQETILEPEIYQAFFDKLSKSVFLEKEGA